MTNMPVSFVMFDLDRTLVDFVHDLACCSDRTLIDPSLPLVRNSLHDKASARAVGICVIAEFLN